MTTRPHSQAPERSLDQRMEALRRANEIRSLRAQLKRDLKTGSVRVTDVILKPPSYVMTAKVFDILMAVPKYGKVKATRFLNTCRISQGKTIGGLSERQRKELVELLGR
ncbi:MAG: integration host factor, actinobacterial type [Thermoleophilia bacterium]